MALFKSTFVSSFTAYLGEKLNLTSQLCLENICILLFLSDIRDIAIYFSFLLCFRFNILEFIDLLFESLSGNQFSGPSKD